MLSFDGTIFGQNVHIVLDTFLLMCYAMGAVVPFVPFFTFGFIAKGGSMAPGYRLAVAWGLGLFSLPLAMLGGVIYALLEGGGCLQGGPVASIMGVLCGTLLLTGVAADQAFKLDKQQKEENRLRKEADASMATSC